MGTVVLIQFTFLVLMSKHILCQTNTACLPTDTDLGQRTAPAMDTQNTGGAVVLMTRWGGINCQGVLTEWEFTVGQNPCRTVTFQVYRPRGLNAYELIGGNELTNGVVPGGQNCANTGTGTVVSYKIPIEQQIPVQPGDIIAWAETNPGMVATDNTGTLNAVRSCATSPTVGASCNSNGPHSIDAYLVAKVRQGTAPTIDNLDATISINEGTLQNNAVLFTIHASHKQNRPAASVEQPDLQLSWNPMTLHNTVFSFNPSTPPPSTTAVLRTLATTINYDITKQYVLHFTVHDGALSDTKTLTVNVLDVNLPHTIDTFVPVTISARLTKAGDKIYQVTVTDPDLTNITTKRFIILSQPISGTFAIDPDTGEVTCAQDLNSIVRPTASQNLVDQNHVLSIAAVDELHNPSASLTINIRDWRIRPAIIGAPITTSVDEDVLRGAEIYKLGVVPDPDRKSLKYEIRTITPNEGWAKFDIDTDTGSIFIPPSSDTSPVFDVSVTTSYTLTVRAVDDLYTSDPVTVRVNINWKNRPPVFDEPKYQEKTINEEEPTGFLVLTLLPVRDRDVDNSLPNPPPVDTLRYSIIPNYASSLFNIPTGTNRLEIRSRIDIDPPANAWMKNMSLTVQVTDGSGLSDTSDVRILVTDVNDNAPIFTQTAYKADVKENSIGGTELTSPIIVTATDADSGWNAEIKYTLQNLVSHPNMDKYFQIHPTDGGITVRHPMDYETAPTKTLQFHAIATDRAGDVTGNTSPTPVTVTVNLIDVNDNQPVFRQNFYNLEARADLLLGYQVVAVHATDADTAAVSRVSYFILIPEPDFAINPNNGSIFVNSNLKTDHKYVLYTYAKDNGTPELLSAPSIVRIDAYSPWKYLIDITLNIPEASYSQAIEDGFMARLNEYLKPWVVKKERKTHDKDKTTLTIYALHDNSTDDIKNLDQPKRFVWRDDILGKLRTDILGTPNDDLKNDPAKPIRVMPTYPIWIRDTIPGIATLSVICFLALLLIILLIVCLMKRFKVCCFKPKPAKPVLPPRTDYEEAFKLNYTKQPEDTKPIVDRKTTSLVETPDNNVRARPRRPPSADTIHSLIYVPHK